MGRNYFKGKRRNPARRAARYVFNPLLMEDLLTVREFVDSLEGIERKIAERLMQGFSQSEIAAMLGLTQPTVSYHLKKIRNLSIKKRLCVGMHMEGNDNAQGH